MDIQNQMDYDTWIDNGLENLVALYRKFQAESGDTATPFLVFAKYLYLETTHATS